MIYVASDSTYRLVAATAENPTQVRGVSLKDLCRANTPIRICAQYRMSRAIVELLEAGRVVDVCAPGMFPAARRDNPEWLLPAMAELPAYSPSVGGFHRAGAVDLATYRISAAITRSAASGTIRDLYERHPVSTPLSFLTGVDPLSVAMLLGYAGDPRWFVNPDRPSRASRFLAFCGASPWRLKQLEQCRPKTRAAWRTFYLVNAWAGAPHEDAAAAPGGVLYRLKRDDGQSWLSTGCQKFASFLYYAWLGEAYADHPMGGGRDLVFLPDMVLRDPADLSNFKAHLQASKACV